MVIINSFAEQVSGPQGVFESQQGQAANLWGSHTLPIPGWREIGINFELLKLKSKLMLREAQAEVKRML